MARAKVAHLVAFTVEVLCPHCYEPQDNPTNGAQNWTREEIFDSRRNDRVCRCCNKLYRVNLRSLVPFYVVG